MMDVELTWRWNLSAPSAAPLIAFQDHATDLLPNLLFRCGSFIGGQAEILPSARIIDEAEGMGDLKPPPSTHNSSTLASMTDPAALTEEDVMDALSNVIDPELGLDFVELGLIYGVEVTGGDVKVTFTLTTPGCPIGPQVNEQIEEFVGELDGVASVESEMVFTPPWSPEMMSEDAKFALGY
jgi:metal-sulfur cluster biosynthetic enzyme